ncbi:hypothetical protein [Chryseobacterium sp.]|uniref:hypothetical protein n=1 Tax=Chryseobacterium sp. TaxID=1871047 RepID=UPI0025BA166D|nr:hypothetical protein [Chryseobacterium sp.]MBV8324875.1 hypothetical protein [Chryseobacterium sp.]
MLQSTKRRLNCAAIIPTHGSYISTAEGKYIAPEQDKQADINIQSFGLCKLKPTSGGYLPCIPAPIA